MTDFFERKTNSFQQIRLLNYSEEALSSLELHEEGSPFLPEQCAFEDIRAASIHL